MRVKTETQTEVYGLLRKSLPHHFDDELIRSIVREATFYAEQKKGQYVYECQYGTVALNLRGGFEMNITLDFRDGD